MQRWIFELAIVFVVAAALFLGIYKTSDTVDVVVTAHKREDATVGNAAPEGTITEAPAPEVAQPPAPPPLSLPAPEPPPALDGFGGGAAPEADRTPSYDSAPPPAPSQMEEMGKQGRIAQEKMADDEAREQSMADQSARDSGERAMAPSSGAARGGGATTARPAPPPTAAAAPPKAAPAPTLHQVTVYYGTDRTLERQGTKLVYGAVPSGKLDYGSVDVTLPPKHERGVLERPEWWRFEFVPDPEKHVVFRGFSRLDRRRFVASVKALVAKSAHKQAFVFIHGFNTSFEDAAMRTAQLHHDLNFDGAPLFYSWSSRAELNPLAYAADGTAADQTVPQLTEFLKLVAEETGAERVHVIAHSMGNRALVAALSELGSRAPAGRNRRPFHQIVLAAPDIDRKVFERLATHIQSEADNITLYASARDSALRASLEFNGFPRAGDATGGVVIVPGITTIDATAVATELFSFGHSFFADSRSVLDDIRALFDAGGMPDARGLRAVRGSNGVYWRID